MKTHCLCGASTSELSEALSPQHLGNPRSRLRDRPKHRKRWFLFGYLLIALLSRGYGASAEVTPKPSSEPLVVNCVDEARQIVQRALAGECNGRAVSDEEAEQIRQHRRAYIQRAIAGDRGLAKSGRRLKSVGSGFFIDRRGMVLTNYHAVRDCEAISVSAATGGTQEARILASEPQNDLALLKTDITPPYAVVFAPAEAPVANTIAVVGYPNRGVPPVRPLITPGTTLKPRPEASLSRQLAFKADIRPGNSGGPILDPGGRVVGVVFSAIDTPRVYQRTGRIVRDIGLAIPNRTVVPFLVRNGVVPATAEMAVAREDMLGYARAFVGRVECWQ